MQSYWHRWLLMTSADGSGHLHKRERHGTGIQLHWATPYSNDCASYHIWLPCAKWPALIETSCSDGNWIPCHRSATGSQMISHHDNHPLIECTCYSQITPATPSARLRPALMIFDMFLYIWQWNSYCMERFSNFAFVVQTVMSVDRRSCECGLFSLSLQ